MTDKVFGENRATSREALAEAMKDELNLAELIVIAREPCDPIGHEDRISCRLDERTVLVNAYSTAGGRFRRRVRRGLGRHRVDLVELPCEPQPGGRDGIPTEAGNWIKFLRIRDVLIAPGFGLRDARALGSLRAVHPGLTVEAVACRRLAEHWGSLHCVPWQGRLVEIIAGPCWEALEGGRDGTRESLSSHCTVLIQGSYRP